MQRRQLLFCRQLIAPNSGWNVEMQRLDLPTPHGIKH